MFTLSHIPLGMIHIFTICYRSSWKVFMGGGSTHIPRRVKTCYGYFYLGQRHTTLTPVLGKELPRHLNGWPNFNLFRVHVIVRGSMCQVISNRTIFCQIFCLLLNSYQSIILPDYKITYSFLSSWYPAEIILHLLPVLKLVGIVQHWIFNIT